MAGVESIRERAQRTEAAAARGNAAQSQRLKRLADAGVARVEAKSRAVELEAAARWERAFKASERARFLKLGGSDAEFEDAWPQLRRQILTRQIEASPDGSSAAVARRMLKNLYKRA